MVLPRVGGNCVAVRWGGKEARDETLNRRMRGPHVRWCGRGPGDPALSQTVAADTGSGALTGRARNATTAATPARTA